MPTTGPDSLLGQPGASPAVCIDHSLLAPTTTAAQIDQLCEEAVEFGCAAVCVPPVRVAQAAQLLYGSGVAVATVIGFPLGYDSPATKQAAAAEALRQGAREIDLVLQLGWAAQGDFAAVTEEIRAIKQLLGQVCLKVIVECALFEAATRQRLAVCALEAGADFVKTSTGFGPAGATPTDVRLLRDATAGRLPVKAAGGIRSLAQFDALRAAGASRIGTSATAAIVGQWLERREQAEMRGHV